MSIASQSQFKKILEPIFAKRLNVLLTKYNVINNLQCGSKAGTSTSHALEDATHCISSCLDKVHFNRGIDFKKSV